MDKKDFQVGDYVIYKTDSTNGQVKGGVYKIIKMRESWVISIAFYDNHLTECGAYRFELATKLHILFYVKNR